MQNHGKASLPKFVAVVLAATVIAGLSCGRAAAASQAMQSQKPAPDQVMVTPPSAIALRDQLRTVLNMTTYSGTFQELGSHVPLTHVGTVYTIRRSNVVVATYFTQDKYAGARVVNPDVEEGHYYVVTKYCHYDSVVTLPEVSLAPLPAGCRRSLAVGRAGFIRAGKQFLITDLEVMPDQDQISFVLMEHHLDEDGTEGPRYGSRVRVRLPHGLLGTADAGQIAAALKPLLAPAGDPILAQSQPFLPDAPLPDYTVEDQLNGMLKPKRFHPMDGTFEPDTLLKVRAARFLRATGMYSAILCSPSFEDGKPLKEGLLCRGIETGEPNGVTEVFVKPNDDLEVGSIKVESKKDKDVVRLVLNDWSQTNNGAPPALISLADLQVNGESVDTSSAPSYDLSGYHTAITFQYPKGALEHDGAKRVFNDINGVFNVVKANAPASQAAAAPVAPLEIVLPTGPASVPQPLEEQLKSLYTLTTLGTNSSITSRGTVFNLAQSNVLLGTPVTKPTMCTATVSDGGPKPPPAACVTPLKGSITRRESQFFPAGQKLDLLGVSVNLQKETVTLTLVDDAPNGGMPHLHTAVGFVFPGGYLEGSDAGQVAEAVNSLLVMSDSTKTAQPVAAMPTPAPAGGRAVAPAPAVGRANTPTQQPAGQPTTVEKGMTLVQVKNVLGVPKTVVPLGVKTIFIYSNLKVTFMNGRVSDVE